MREEDPRLVFLFTFVLAFCSLFYELVFAQVLSVCLGGTKIQYLTTISLFTCALGFGSLMQGRVRLRWPLRKSFFYVELFLTVLGSAGPFLITWLLRPSHSQGIAVATTFLSYFIIILIGLLSGFEIPSLFAMARGSQGKVLACDYLGMLAATVCFPLLFLPGLGTAASTLFVAGLNALSLVWLRSDRPRVVTGIALYFICALYLCAIVFYREPLNDWLSLLYLGRT